ncbi:MAG TPA: tetratricopeptide repeat protein [Bryobacteraceae bacterium]
MFADLICRPGKEAAAKAALERLTQQDPNRPEPHRALAYLAWHDGQHENASELFGKAYELGARDPKLLWDYGRLLEERHAEQAIRVLSELLSRDEGRTEVRLELAAAQLRANRGQAALKTLGPMRSITAADAPLYFRIAVDAHLLAGDPRNALETAKHFRDLAKTDEARHAAEQLVSLAEKYNVSAGPAGPAEATEGGPPRMRRSGPDSEPNGILRQQPLPPRRPSAIGRFVELVCVGKQAHMIIETAQGRKVFVIDEPEKVRTSTNSSVEMTCGPQKTPLKVEVGYDTPPANQKGLDGMVRELVF